MAAVWFWLLLPLVCLPWLLGLVWGWRRRPHDGWLPPSLGEQARRRLAAR